MGDSLPSKDRRPRRRRSRRTESKAASRAKILDAAEALFTQRSWQATTLRDVAAAADVSTGAIFSNFQDKTALFIAVLERDLALLLQEINACIGSDGPIEEVLLATFLCGYQHYDRKLPFLRTVQHVMWAEDCEPLHELMSQTPLPALFTARLRVAVASAELVDARLGVRGHMLADSYLANYAHALYGSWDLAILRKRSQAQIEVILAGARP